MVRKKENSKTSTQKKWGNSDRVWLGGKNMERRKRNLWKLNVGQENVWIVKSEEYIRETDRQIELLLLLHTSSVLKSHLAMKKVAWNRIIQQLFSWMNHTYTTIFLFLDIARYKKREKWKHSSMNGMCSKSSMKYNWIGNIISSRYLQNVPCVV